MSAMLTPDEVLDEVAAWVDAGAFTAGDGVMWEYQGSEIDPDKPWTRLLTYTAAGGATAQFRVRVTAVTT